MKLVEVTHNLPVEILASLRRRGLKSRQCWKLQISNRWNHGCSKFQSCP